MILVPSGNSTLHHLSTNCRAELILLTENGRVTERDTHEELMSARATYHGMLLCQIESRGQQGETAVRGDVPQVSLALNAKS